MRYAFALATLSVLAISPTLAQPAEPAPSAPITSIGGVLGIGHLYSRGGSMFGIDTAIDLRHRRHALGLRARTYAPLLSFGPAPQLWEAAGVYSFNVVGGLSLGAGVSYVSERYRLEAMYDLLQSTHIGVPLEVTFRPRGPERFGPYLRGTANMKGLT